MAAFNGDENGNNLVGGDESDTFFGGGGNDTLVGQGGDDRIYGEEGNDVLLGRAGDDILVGGNGNDNLYGTATTTTERQRDTLFGGGGKDLFRLGVGTDIYYDSFSDSDLAIIEDFRSGEDKVVLTGSSDLYSLTTSGSNTNIYSGEDELIAIVKSNPNLSFAADVDFSGGQDLGFDIEFNFTDDNLSDSQRAIVEDAGERWSEIIVGDLPNVGDIDDLSIEVVTEDLEDETDGDINLLGRGGFTNIRSDSSLPYEGIIRLDIEDVDRLEREGRLDDLVLHEIGHALGVGTLWDDLDLLTGAGGDDPGFTGTGAIREYNDIFGNNELSVPVENMQQGRDAHWRETDFNLELMSSRLNSTPILPISRITVASLGDLGYEVDLDAADDFIAPKIDLRTNPGEIPTEAL